jgi:hypothetical protein
VLRIARVGRIFLMVGALLLTAAPSTLASTTTVDPNTLIPPPTPGSTCVQNGQLVICRVELTFAWTNEPAFELPCGVVYETRTEVRSVTRRYLDQRLVTRLVHADGEGNLSLSPTGAGPIARFFVHTTWGETYTIPGDLDSQVGHQRGNDLTVLSPDGGVIAKISGRTHGPEEDFDGIFHWIDGPADPGVAAEISAALCEALDG